MDSAVSAHWGNPTRVVILSMDKFTYHFAEPFDCFVLFSATAHS